MEMASIKPVLYFTRSHHAVNAVKVTVLCLGDGLKPCLNVSYLRREEIFLIAAISLTAVLEGPIQI